jgi:hypothetical protein
MKTKLVILLPILFLFSACAGMNPNPGERTTDIAWLTGDFDKAYSIVKLRAEDGQPWAQLRLGIFYENGWGVKKDANKAAYWYKKAANQAADGGWANGQVIGAVGKLGYFNQNSDALIAKYNLANLYYKGEGITRDLITAYVLIDNVINLSKGSDVYFCCQFDEARYFTQDMFITLKKNIVAEMSDDQILQAKKIIEKTGS